MFDCYAVWMQDISTAFQARKMEWEGATQQKIDEKQKFDGTITKKNISTLNLGCDQIKRI